MSENIDNLRLCATSHEWSCTEEDFDNWLNEERAKAFDQGAVAMDMSYTSEWPENPYRKEQS